MMMLDAEVALLHALWIVFAGILIIFHPYASTLAHIFNCSGTLYLDSLFTVNLQC